MIIDESEEHDEVEIIIKCPRMDERLARLIEQIKHYEIKITGKRDGRTFPLAAEDVFYIESVDNKAFLYDEEAVYESELKLYELERLVEGTHFIRVSKNLIVNTTHIESVRALFNGKFEATLTNREKVIVNRHYVKAFKAKFLT